MEHEKFEKIIQFGVKEYFDQKYERELERRQKEEEKKVTVEENDEHKSVWLW